MPDALPPLVLVLGGARSGKSRQAEALVESWPAPWTYVATAEAFDAEMTARIAEHRARRPEGWVTLEAPRDLPGVLGGVPPVRPVLVDCLTLWLSNLLLAERDLAAEGERLAAVLAQRSGPVVLVSNEVGSGIVPETPLGRRFRDAQGRLNQRMAAAADRVVLVVAGIPVAIKGAVG